MSTWAARAKAHLAETGHTSTDKTDERGVLSVMSVRPGALLAKQQGVSSVSSVGVMAIFGNRLLAADLMAAAMRRCDQFKDGEKAREEMRQDVLATPLHLQQDLLEYFNECTKDAALFYRQSATNQGDGYDR